MKFFPLAKVCGFSVCAVACVSLFGCVSGDVDVAASGDNGGAGGDNAANGGAAGAGTGGNPSDSNAGGMAGGGQQTGGSGASVGGKGGGGPDGGVVQDAASPSDVRPTGLVPVFVAAGQGGRTITSCDDGKTWIADHSYGGNEDHSPYTHKGLTYGNGMFMVVMGWGAQPSVKFSADAVTWSRNANFPSNIFFGGIAYGGDRFVILRQGSTQYSSDLGKTWKKAAVQPRNDYREGGGGHGLPGAKGVFGGGGGDIPSMSWDGGDTFTSTTGCPTIDFGGIGTEGGVAAANGHLVFVSSNGDYCHVSDMGKTYSKGNLGTQVRGKLFFTGGKFWVTSGNSIFSSTTGDAWTKTTASPASTSLQAFAVGDSGTFVGIGSSGADFYRSADGVAWQKVAAPTGNRMVRVVFGYASPSDKCKL